MERSYKEGTQSGVDPVTPYIFCRSMPLRPVTKKSITAVI